MACRTRQIFGQLKRLTGMRTSSSPIDRDQRMNRPEAGEKRSGRNNDQ